MPGEANGEISRTPAGGWELSETLAAPAGRPVAAADAIELKVTTISPWAR